MSFILDALKKSEAERQRQSGPTLLELRVTPPRRRYPVWTLWVGALLALNAAILLVVLLRHPAAPAEPVAPPLAMRPQIPASAPVAAAPVTTAPAAVVAVPPGPPVGAVAPLAASPPAPAANAAPPTAAASPNPADDEPALPAPPPPVSAPSASSTTTVPSADYETLPNLSSLSGNVPNLQLNLLDYSDLQSERYALVNMHRVREGDVLPEGPRVLAITRDGVAFDYNGQQFMLRSSGGAGATP